MACFFIPGGENTPCNSKSISTQSCGSKLNPGVEKVSCDQALTPHYIVPL